MATKQRNNRAATGGTPGGGGTNQSAPVPGSFFRVPKYSTRRRFVPDTLNTAVAVAPAKGVQVNVPLTKLDQLDIVKGLKMTLTGLKETFTTGANPDVLTVSPFYPASKVLEMEVKLQAAYDSYRQTGPLAAIAQAFRPMVGWRKASSQTLNAFCNVGASNPNLAGVQSSAPDMTIDVPLSWHFDEYYDLDQKGNPLGKYYDALVTPQFMAAQARVVNPSVVLAPAIATSDLLHAGVSETGAATATYALGQAGTLRVSRDAFWTAKNPASNPPQYPWQYTRDYFASPTSGQSPAQVLIQNTGVSVGQVMSLYGFVWDPDANGGQGQVVPMSSIQKFQLVTGGSLINQEFIPSEVTDRMHSMYNNALGGFPSGVFVLDFALSEDGGYLTNQECINTYLVNGVALNITFNAGSVPGPKSTVYLAVEALKLATS